MTPIALGLAALAAAMAWLTLRPLWRAGAPTTMTFGRRSVWMAAYALLAVLSFLVVPPSWKEFSASAQSQQLAGNGVWEFFHAFNTNEIDYDRFYATVPLERAQQSLREEFLEAGTPDFTNNPALPFERRVHAAGPEKKLNVVLISVESLSAEFLGSFGNTHGLTRTWTGSRRRACCSRACTRRERGPCADWRRSRYRCPPRRGTRSSSGRTTRTCTRSAKCSPTRLRAHLPVRRLRLLRQHGALLRLQRLHVHRSRRHRRQGRHPLREHLGVADEDLFTLTLRELDQRHAAGRPFFAHVMTTSNHRPFTYPAGRVDIPPGTSADGAVKYTDWALGDFIERARSRPWFDDTVFVIIADHCGRRRGKTDLPLDRFHIPMLIYAPKYVQPARIETVASQIDVPPTILALLNFSYVSRFFGQDILTRERSTSAR